MASEYVFVDEWDVAASPEAVYDTIVDARTYPTWWKPVYIAVEGDERETRHRRCSNRSFGGTTTGLSPAHAKASSRT